MFLYVVINQYIRVDVLELKSIYNLYTIYINDFVVILKIFFLSNVSFNAFKLFAMTLVT